ncbi:MAG: lipocalin family protein [Solobacterium sp.]|nr:lipocalin family protein [Solobacterium sp.]
MIKTLFRLKAFIAVFCAAVLCACSSAPAKEAVIGSWTLDRVYAAEAGEELTERDPETAASLFGDLDGYYTFEENGDAVHGFNGGGEFVEDKGKWEKDADLQYVFTDDRGKMTFTYSADDDTLHSVWSDESQTEGWVKIEYVYKRKK